MNIYAIDPFFQIVDANLGNAISSEQEIDTPYTNSFDVANRIQKDIDEFKMPIQHKVENLIRVIKNLSALEYSIKREEIQLKTRREVITRKIEHFKNFVGLLVGPFVKFECSSGSIGWRKSESVKILDEKAIPEQYMKCKMSWDANKDLIKQSLKEGAELPWAVMEEKQNIQIK